MVPIMDIDLYELKSRIIKEILYRLEHLNIKDHPTDYSWLLYALYQYEKNSNLYKENNDSFFNKYKRYTKILEDWIESAEIGTNNKYLAPLSVLFIICVRCPRAKKELALKKIRTIIRKLTSLRIDKYNALNDPSQIFFLSFVLPQGDDNTRKIKEFVKRSLSGKLSRKVLFIDSLIRWGDNPKDLFKYLNIKDLDSLNDIDDINDIISLLWLFNRHKKNSELIKLWRLFRDIFYTINIKQSNKVPYIETKSLALLCEVITGELKHPNPYLLFNYYPFLPEIREIAEQYFQHKEYPNAIFEVVKKLNEYIKDITETRDKDEKELVQATMKNLKNQKPKIQFNNHLNDKSGKNEQNGLALIAEGIFTAFRNPIGHKPKDHPLVKIDAHEALARLIIIDYIWKRIIKAKINKQR